MFENRTLKKVRAVLEKIEEDARTSEQRAEEALERGTAQAFLISETQREMSSMYARLLKEALDG